MYDCEVEDVETKGKPKDIVDKELKRLHLRCDKQFVENREY